MTEWIKEEMDQEILECARYGEDEDLNVFLSAGANVNFVDSNGNTAMHKAAANGNVNCMKVLKSFGANYVVNNEGNFPAHWAAQNGKLAALQFLVDNYDVDMLAKNSVGRSILTEAFASKDEQCIELCLSHPSANEERLANFTGQDQTKITINEEDNENEIGSESAAAKDSDDQNNNEEGEEVGVTHTFNFTPSISELGPVVIRCRELPIGGGDQSNKSKSVLGEGGRHEEDSTGLSLWPASLLLSRWIAAAATEQGSQITDSNGTISLDSQFFTGKNIMEIGCGCALPAIAVKQHHSGVQGTVYATDLHQRTLKNAAYNVALNGLTPHDIRVEALDWASALLVANPLSEETQENTENPTPSFEFPHEHEMDILLASDLIYDRDVLQLFCSAARRLLKGNGQGHLLYVAPQSGRDGLDNLVAVLQAHGIELVARVATPEDFYRNPMVCDDADDQLVLHFYDFAGKEPHYCCLFRTAVDTQSVV